VWAAGDFRKKVVEAPQRERAAVTVRVRTENVAGVKLPVFTLVKAASADAELDVLGIAGGGRQIGAARDKFRSLLEGLVRLGSLQTSFLTLDQAIKLTNRVRIKRQAACGGLGASVVAPRCGTRRSVMHASVGHGLGTRDALRRRASLPVPSVRHARCAAPFASAHTPLPTLPCCPVLSVSTRWTTSSSLPSWTPSPTSPRSWTRWRRRAPAEGGGARAHTPSQ